MENNSSIDLYILLVGGTLAFLLLSGGIVTFIITYKRRILEKNLELRNNELEHQKEMYLGTLEATEIERQRVARELHDEIGSSLSAMRLISSQFSGNLENSTDNLKSLIDSTIDNVRRISNDLLPIGLEEFGLEFALENLIEDLTAVSDIKIEYQIEGLSKSLHRKELMIYRIVQELVNNTIKYAHATIIGLTIIEKDSTLGLMYQDNGIGFELANTLKTKSLGLKNITARTKSLGGEAKFDTAPQKGFKFEMQIPK